MSKIITRAAAWEQLNKYNKEHFHIRHALTVEGVMKYFANELCYGDEADIAEFVSRLKRCAGATELTHEMCLELIEDVTVDENNKNDKSRPRVIHIYYKLIDKLLTNKNNALT